MSHRNSDTNSNSNNMGLQRNLLYRSSFLIFELGLQGAEIGALRFSTSAAGTFSDAYIGVMGIMENKMETAI